MLTVAPVLIAGADMADEDPRARSHADAPGRNTNSASGRQLRRRTLTGSTYVLLLFIVLPAALARLDAGDLACRPRPAAADSARGAPPASASRATVRTTTRP